MQEKYIEMEILRQQLIQLNQQKNELNLRLSEVSSAKQSISDISEMKNGGIILANIGGGTFIKAAIDDTENVIANIGSGISVRKNTKEYIKTIEAQESQLLNVLKDIDRNTIELEMYSQNLAAEFQDMERQKMKEKDQKPKKKQS